MNTLRSWANKNDVVVARHGHARTVSADAPNQSDLFRLDDYLVSSVAAGTVWLIRREPFTPAERQLRGNVRNACVGQKVRELERLYGDHTDMFTQDCIQEYLFELEAEERDACRWVRNLMCPE